MKKTFRLALPLLAAGAFVAASSAASAADCTTKVGAVLPTSVDWGRPIAETAQFAVDLFNQAGGVKGCKVEMILRDTQVDPKVGVDAAKALVDLEKVPLLFGAVSSGVSMPILTSVSVPSNVMQMSCCSSSTAFTKVAAAGKTKGLWFRTFATVRNQAGVTAMAMRDKGIKSVGIFYKNDDWGQDIGKLVGDDLKAIGVNITGMVAINNDQPSYRAEVTELLKTKPDVVYLALYPKEGAAVVREWISLGGTQKMVVSNSLKSADFRDAVGLKYLGETFGMDSAPPRVESAATFSKVYEAHFKKPPSGPGLPNIFDAVMISLLAMEAAPNLTGDQIAAQIGKITDPGGMKVFPDVAGIKAAKEALAAGKTISFTGGTGAVSFDANGDVSAPGVTWVFTKSGFDVTKYYPLNDVDKFISSLGQ